MSRQKRVIRQRPVSGQGQGYPMNWPRIWFALLGAAQIFLGALALLVWKMNRSTVVHDVHRALPVGMALIVLGLGALWRERVCVALSSIGFACLGIAVLYADRELTALRLMFEVTYAAVLFLPAVFSFRFRRETRWIV